MTDAVPAARLRQRLLSIDALRGLVILFMLLDHVRETFLLHRQVSDPMSIDSTEPALFISRTLAHLCAPVFVLLTGLSAYLYGEKYQGRGDVAAFLFKRGLFLVVLEFTLVNFAWTFQLPPQRDLYAGDLGHRREHDRPRRVGVAAPPAADRPGAGDHWRA